MSYKPHKKLKSDVILIESDSETTDGETSPADRERRRADKSAKRIPVAPVDLTIDTVYDSTVSSSRNVSGVCTNRIPALPDSENVDVLTLMDILSADLRETWQINFSIDVQYTIDNIHPAARDGCKIHFITAGQSVREQISVIERQDQVELHEIKIQDQWGTHHSKVMINFFTDETCQIVVHTANLLRVDWEEKSEAIWLSPRLYRQSTNDSEQSTTRLNHGFAFKADVIDYLKSYRRTSIQPLITQLTLYDFSPVKAIFIPSIPGSYDLKSHSCGLAKLEHVLRKSTFTALTSDLTIAQVSSLGSLGKPFYEKVQTALDTAPEQKSQSTVSSHFRLIFPTVEDVRDSISGWISGFSLFFNASSAGGARQIALSKAHLCRWVSNLAGRARVMPHIKTYARVSADGEAIRWIWITSANMSKAALGAVESGRIKIKSYEAGILLVPDLFGDEVVMKPSYRCNNQHKGAGTINIRLPYDLTVERYKDKDEIWSLSRNPVELGLDWRGLSLSDLVPS